PSRQPRAAGRLDSYGRPHPCREETRSRGQPLSQGVVVVVAKAAPAPSPKSGLYGSQLVCLPGSGETRARQGGGVAGDRRHQDNAANRSSSPACLRVFSRRVAEPASPPPPAAYRM